jgi:hypothetical protein
MYKLKTGRHFEKNASYVPPIPPPAADGENLPAADKLPTSPLFSHAVSLVELCPESRLLLVASASGQVTLFRFVKVDGCQEIAVSKFHRFHSKNFNYFR